MYSGVYKWLWFTSSRVEAAMTMDQQVLAEGTVTASSGRQQKGLRESARSILIPAIALILITVTWEAYVRLADVPLFIIPPASDVLREMVTDFGGLWPSMWATLHETLLGFGASIAVGVPLAIVLVSFRPLEEAIYPLLVASQVVPKIAIAPVFVVWWGFGIFPKIMVVFLIAFFPIVISTAVGLRETEVEKIYLAQTMGAGRIQTLTRFRLPGALPSMFGGIKVAATLAVIGAVVAEFVAADVGLGHAIVRANARIDTVAAFAAIGWLTIIGVVLYGSIDVLERVLLPWHVSRRSAA